MHKHLLCAAFNIKLTTGSGNAGTCEKLHDRSRIRLRQKPVCVQAPLGSIRAGGGKGWDFMGGGYLGGNQRLRLGMWYGCHLSGCWL